MESASAFVSKMIRILRMGVVIGVTTGVIDEDYETGEKWFTPISEHEFKTKDDGKVYCNGTSVMFPKPVTDEEGWEIEPVDEYFLEDLFAYDAQEMYVKVGGKKITIWTKDQGWDSSVKFLNANALKEKMRSEDKSVSSLKLLCADAVLDSIGGYAMDEIKDYFDFEVQKCLKSKSWWIQW